MESDIDDLVKSLWGEKCTENEQEKIIYQGRMGGIHGRLTKFLTYAVIHTHQVNYDNGDDDLLTKTQVTQHDMNTLEEFL